MTDRTAAESQHQNLLPRLPLLVLLTVAAAALTCVAHVVAQHTVEIVRARRLLPGWDLATHLGNDWLDYHLLATGQIHRLL